MEKIITILKEDILTNPYIDCTVCPITIALQRAGINAIHGGGTNVLDRKNGKGIGRIHHSVRDTVCLMYSYIEDYKDYGTMTPADFSTKVEIY